MRRLFEHKVHLVRMAGLFAVGAVAFFVLQLLLTPKSFGVYGHYRADALGEIAAKAPVHAGRAVCGECHDEQAAKLKSGAHARLGCEACHGPLGQHAANSGDPKPQKPDVATLCLRCHLQNTARPAKFPQVDPKDHGEGTPCNGCHVPHSPKETP